MLLNNDDVKTTLLFVLKPILKDYNLYIEDAVIKIDERISIQAILYYNNKQIEMQGTCLLMYKNHQLIIDDIQGEVHYSIVTLDLLTVIKQLVKGKHCIVKDQKVIIDIKLPITSITHTKNLLTINMEGSPK